MAPKQSSTYLSPSGRVEYAITNHVAFMEKESVHADFHFLMDFLKISPVSYALTASPTIYAEVVQEMWTTACCSKGVIKLKIKGNSYSITTSVINQALHLPVSNFENLPTDKEIFAMLRSIKYASGNGNLSHISRNHLGKEWSYFFDTLSKVFVNRCGNYIKVTKFVLIIGYSLMYNRTIDIGSLLLQKFSKRLGNNVGDRSQVIYYARFLMIIANHLCKELSIRDRGDTLQVFGHTVTSFDFLLDKNAKVEFVLPDHIQTQLSTLSPSPVHDTMGKDPISSTKVTLNLHSLSGKEATTPAYGKRKNFALPTITAGTSEGINEEATDKNPAKKLEASIVKLQTGLSDVDPQLPPCFSMDGVPVKLEPNSPEENVPQGCQQIVNQYLVNTASILKSQLVGCLTSSADKLSPNDMMKLADKSYSALKAIGDDYTSVSRVVNKLIERRQVLEDATKSKENFDRDIKARYIQQEMSLSVVSNKLSGAQETLFRAETYVESLKKKLLELTEELSEEEKRVKNLVAERDQSKEVHSVIEAQLRKLDADKEYVSVAFEETNDQYNAAKDELERMNDQLLQLVRKG